MFVRTRSSSHVSVCTRIRGLVFSAGLGGIGLLLAGCGAAAGLGAGLVAAWLTGIFLGGLQASFDATARSYGYTDSGSARFVFAQPQVGLIQLTHFLGRLPGFYMVIINADDDKAMSRMQGQEPVVFGTDVEIDFQTVPATISGTVKQIDGDQEFDLFELYPEIESASVSVDEGEEAGVYDVRLGIVARDAEGGHLDYGLTWHAQLTPSGVGLEGGVEVDRALTTAAGEEIVIEGTGSASTTRQ